MLPTYLRVQPWRRSALALLLGAGLATLAAPVRAANLGFAGTLEFLFVGLPPLAFSDSGVATVNGSGPAGHLSGVGIAASQLATTGLAVLVTDPAVGIIGGLHLTARNGAGSFGGLGGAGFGGPMPLQGTAKLCLFGACGASDNQANLSVPLSVAGHQATAVRSGGLFKLTVIGAPWTTGTASIGMYTAMGGVSPLSNTGVPSGVLNLVTPIFISTDLGSPIIPFFGSLSVHFVPEPTTLALVAAGIAGIVAGAVRRRGSER